MLRAATPVNCRRKTRGRADDGAQSVRAGHMSVMLADYWS